jgi:hypothetical protein
MLYRNKALKVLGEKQAQKFSSESKAKMALVAIGEQGSLHEVIYHPPNQLAYSSPFT